jgi:hypothetical protein
VGVFSPKVGEAEEAEIIGNMATMVEITVETMVETMTTIGNPKHQRIDALSRLAGPALVENHG